MNEELLRGSHKHAECTGTWIDITTLAGPRRAMCTECRARPTGVTTEALQEQDAMRLLARRTPPASSQGFTRRKWLLVGGAVIAVVVITVAVLLW
jgi:hypothetical protein